jgi:hypothetical protein
MHETHLRGDFQALRDAWPLIEGRARQHDGVLATAWLRQRISERVIGRAVDDRLLFRVHRGVVSITRDLTPRGRIRAGYLAAGEGAVVAGRAAVALHGLLPLRADVDIIVPTHRSSHRGVTVRQATIDPRDIRTRHGMRVLAIPRLLIDCAHLPELDLVIHEIEVARKLDLGAIDDALNRYPGRRGAKALRAALRQRDPGQGRTRSELERRGRRFLKRHGFPPYKRGTLFELPDGTVIERDVHWPQHRTVLELDGRGVHETARAYEDDRREDGLLLAHLGLHTVRATWAQLGADELADTLWRVLRRAA